LQGVPSRGDLPSLSWLVEDFGRRFNVKPEQNLSVSIHCSWQTKSNLHGGWLEPMALLPGSYHNETSWGPDLDPVVSMTFATTSQIKVENMTVLEPRAGEGSAFSLFNREQTWILAIVVSLID
jgi:hypothetical protein